MESQTNYRIRDAHTGQWANARIYTSRKVASRAANRMDLAYGAVRYIVEWC